MLISLRRGGLSLALFFTPAERHHKTELDWRLSGLLAAFVEHRVRNRKVIYFGLLCEFAVIFVESLHPFELCSLGPSHVCLRNVAFLLLRIVAGLLPRLLSRWLAIPVVCLGGRPVPLSLVSHDFLNTDIESGEVLAHCLRLVADHLCQGLPRVVKLSICVVGGAPLDVQVHFLKLAPIERKRLDLVVDNRT